MGEIGLNNFAPYLMNRIMGRYNATLRADMAHQGMSTPKMRALAVLAVIDGILIRELAVYAVVEQSTLSRALDGLAAEGLIRRAPDRDDSRATRVFITDAGRATFERQLAGDGTRERPDVPRHSRGRAAGPLSQRCKRSCATCAATNSEGGRMAERSFKREVEHLRMGAGESFTGEGILAITKALLENGVGYVGGYQGAPISHLMDVLADAEGLLGELGVRFEANASEAAAAAMLAASVHYPIRGAVTFKGVGGCQRGFGCARQPRVIGGQWRGADHRGRGLRRGLVDHAGAQPRLCHEIAILAAGPATQPALDREGGGRRVRAFRGEQHAGDADGAHPVVPRDRQFSTAATTSARL